MSLIRKGQFRERANRGRRYHQSENHQTQLTQHHYMPVDDALQNINHHQTVLPNSQQSNQMIEKTAVYPKNEQ